MSQRKSPPPTWPPLDEPLFTLLAEGDPPRPVNNDKTAEEEDGSKGDSETASSQDIRHFRVLRGEDQSVYDNEVTALLGELAPWDTVTELMVDNMARAQWHLYRSDFYFQSDLDRAGGNFIDTALKFERYRASTQRRLITLQKHFSELRAARLKEAHATAVEAAKRPKYGPDGKAYEVNRTYSICKLSNNPSPRHYIHNFATEKIILSDGKYWFARTIPLVELMDGEFFKPKYGLGNHFQEAFREWRQTNKLYHPGEPYVTKKWPPPLPENCPPDDSFLDQELSLAEDPLAIVRQRAERMDMEEMAELRRQIEEAREAEAEDRRRELEEELRQKEEEETARRDEEDQRGGEEEAERQSNWEEEDEKQREEERRGEEHDRCRDRIDPDDPTR